MKRYSIHILFFVTVLLLGGCQRRDLAYDYQEGVSLRLNLDWSSLKETDGQPLYVKALFFPTEGGQAIERFIDPSGQEIKVPEGNYRIIVYTWRTNASAQIVQFRGESYENFVAYTQENPQRIPVVRSGNTIPVVPQPDELYVWSNNMPVEFSYTKGMAGKSGAPKILTAVMGSRVHHYELEVNIRNAEQIHSLYAVISEAYGSVPLGGGKPGEDRYGLFVGNLVRVSQAGDVTTYRCRVATFGFCDSDKSFILNITNKEGGGQQEVIDITRQIDDHDNGTISGEEPIVVAPKEDPVVIEKIEIGSGGFVPPSLDDWNRKDENIEI